MISNSNTHKILDNVLRLQVQHVFTYNATTSRIGRAESATIWDT